MYLKVLSCILAIALCGMMPLNRFAHAAKADEGTGIYSLGEVVVSGKNDGVQATESVYTVTAEDIHNKDARTLDQAINLLPGVNVRVGGDGVPRIDVRGFRTRHVILLLDGIPINSALDGQFDPTIIPTENISRIKLTAGGSSVLYGQGGLGGVINIITKKGANGLQGMVSGETGDHETYLGRATISGSKNKFDYFLSGSSTKITAFPLSDDFSPTSEQGTGYRKNSDKKRNNAFGNIGFNPTEDLSLGFSFSYANGQFGKPSSVINDPLDPFANPPKFERIDSFENFSAQVAADYDVSKRFNVRGWLYLNQSTQQDNLYDNIHFNSFNLLAGSFQEQIRTAIEGMTLQPRYDMGNAGAVTLTLSSEWDYWQNEGVQTLALNAFGPLNADHSFRIYSLSAQYEVSPLKGLGLVAGYGHFWQLKNENTVGAYSVQAGAYYDLFRDTRLKASFNRNIRFPTLSDLYDLQKGNPDLQNEVAYTYEGGVEQKLPLNSVASLTGFYTTAKNLIQNDQVTGQNMNVTKVDFAGFEVSAATQFVKQLLLRASFSYLDSRSYRTGYQEQQYTPMDKLTVEGKYDFSCGFSPYFSVLYVGNQFFYTKNSVTPVQKMRLNDFTLVNVKLNQKLFRDKLNLYVGVNNVFDQNYESSYGFPQAGRFVYGGVEYRFGI